MGALAVGDGLEAFLAGIRESSRTPDAVSVFHAVRRLPYLSTGDRSLAGILARRAGSCSSKHILLAALLERIGVPAEVELVLGDFATPLRAAHGLPAEIMAVAREGVRDVHNIVSADIGGRRLVLDATWHDEMRPFGLRVNDRWQGSGDTTIAVDVTEMLGASADPAADKAKLIGLWPAEEQARRRHFLELVNNWVAGVQQRAPELENARESRNG